MSEARDAIFARLQNRSGAVDERPRPPDLQVRPAFAEAPRERFLIKVRSASATVEELDSVAAVPAAAAAYLERRTETLDRTRSRAVGSMSGAHSSIRAPTSGALPLAPTLCVAPAPLLRSLDWNTSFPDASEPRVRIGTIRADDPNALTVAYAAVAETGSLVLLSGHETPTSLNFLPDVYLCVVLASRIVSHLEDLWSLMRLEDQPMPRSLNWIGGPSRTADVEQTVQLGAHGPHQVHVFLVHER